MQPRLKGVCESTQFYLAPGSRLKFYSDGVVEAQSAKTGRWIPDPL